MENRGLWQRINQVIDQNYDRWSISKNTLKIDGLTRSLATEFENRLITPEIFEEAVKATLETQNQRQREQALLGNLGRSDAAYAARAAAALLLLKGHAHMESRELLARSFTKFLEDLGEGGVVQRRRFATLTRAVRMDDRAAEIFREAAARSPKAREALLKMCADSQYLGAATPGELARLEALAKGESLGGAREAAKDKDSRSVDDLLDRATDASDPRGAAFSASVEETLRELGLDKGVRTDGIDGAIIERIGSARGKSGGTQGELERIVEDLRKLEEEVLKEKHIEDAQRVRRVIERMREVERR